MSVPWYAQVPKDIATMYSCCNYGKQHEELLKTAKHLGHRWYTMAKFCETNFAQSELTVYKNFEKNYKTYRTTWPCDAGAFEPELDATKIATATKATTTTESAQSKATT